MVGKLVNHFTCGSSNLLGVTLAGAGGGGFLAALAKTSADARNCEELITKENIPNVSLFSAQIDRHGPVITFS